MYNGTTDQSMYDRIDVDDDQTPDSLIEIYKHSNDDPLTGLDDVFIDDWPFEAEDTEFFTEERPRQFPKPLRAKWIRPVAPLGRIIRRRPERTTT
jgi:hypothetical protein